MTEEKKKSIGTRPMMFVIENILKIEGTRFPLQLYIP